MKALNDEDTERLCEKYVGYVNETSQQERILSVLANENKIVHSSVSVL